MSVTLQEKKIGKNFDNFKKNKNFKTKILIKIFFCHNDRATTKLK